jgi:hypothetical protein
MTTGVYIENPMVGKTYQHDDEFGVYEYGVYPEGSVLAGQEKRSLKDRFPTLEEAREAYPAATVANGSLYLEITIPESPPEWFDPELAGERWGDE